MTYSRFLRTVVVVLALVAATACATRVSRVLNDPSKYRNREVTVSGNVVDSFSIMNRGVYRIEDKTGSLWVVSDKGVPRTGARATVTGTIREGFNAGNLASRLPAGVASGIVLVERKHSVKD